jgi:hypothetical protein
VAGLWSVAEDATAEDGPETFPGLWVTVKSEWVGPLGVATFGWGAGGTKACGPCVLVVVPCMAGVDSLSGSGRERGEKSRRNDMEFEEKLLARVETAIGFIQSCTLLL